MCLHSLLQKGEQMRIVNLRGDSAPCCHLLGVSHRDLFRSLRGDRARSDCLDSLERVGRVVAIATLITYPDQYVLKDHKAQFVFEGFALHLPSANGPLTILAPISELIRHSYRSATL